MTKNTQLENKFGAKLSQPALRALAGAGIQNLAQLAKFSEKEIKDLHGMGPTGIVALKASLKAKGLSFKS
jgi:hypothetical protein